MAGEHTGRGIAAGILGAAPWGAAVPAPASSPRFSPQRLPATRYLFYGSFAAPPLAPSLRRAHPRLHWRDGRALVWFRFAGNAIDDLVLASGAQHGELAMASLLIGLLLIGLLLIGLLLIGLSPSAVSVVGSRDRRAVWRRRPAPALKLARDG